MAADGSIIIDTKLDQSGLKKDLSVLKTTLGKGVKVAAKSAAIAIAGITAAIAVVAKGTKEFTELAKEINSMAKMAGVGAEAFQEMAYAANQYGVNQDALTDGLKELQLRADEFIETGSGSGAEAFERLGYSAQDLSDGLQDVPGLFSDVIGRLEDMDKAAQIRILDEVFGGQAGEQFTALAEGGVDAFEAMKEEAQALGVVMSQDVVDSGVILAHNLDNLKSVGKGLFTEIFSGLAPVLTSAANALLEFVKGAGGVQGIVASIGDYFRDIGLEIKIAWIKTIDTLSRVAYRWVQGFRVDAANMNIAWVSAMQGMKIGIFSLSAAIYDKLLPAVADMINFFSWVPFIGDDFAAAADKVNSFNDELQAGYEEDIQAGREMIQQAKDNRDAIVEEIDGEVDARKEATAQKIDDLRELSDAEKEARAEERAAEREREAAEAKENQAKKDNLAKLKALASLESSFRAEQAKNQQKHELGLLTEEELIEKNISAMESYINSLIDMGVTADSAASEGGAALQNLLELLSGEKAKLQAAGGGGEIGESFAEGIGTGIIETASSVLATTKNIIGNVLGVVSSVADSITGAISWAAAFDVDELWGTFEELINGIEEFFFTDLGSLPVYFEAGATMIQDLIAGIEDNWDVLAETIENVIMSFVSFVSENLPDVLDLGADILMTLLNGITSNLAGITETIQDVIGILIGSVVNSLPALIEIGGELIMSLLTGLSENAEALSAGIFGAISEAIMFVADNIGDIVDLGVGLISGFIKGFAKSLPDLIKAITKALPQIVALFITLGPMLALEAPEIIYALLEGLVLGIMEMPGALISAIISVFTDFIDAIKNFFGIHSPSTVFAGFGHNMIQGLINGILNLGSNLWSSVKSVFSSLWDGIVNVFSGAFDLGAGIIDGISNGINSAVSGVGNFFGDIGSGIGDFFGGFFANGTNFAPGGLSIVGERGPELVNLPKGSKVYTNSQTEQLLSAGSSVSSSVGAVAMGGMPITVYVNGTMEVDGQEIGRISYEYLDEVAAGA